ncbi:MAG: 3-hydroxyacyl-ACP dehydratase FabZ [Spirochaetota bacterium]
MSEIKDLLPHREPFLYVDRLETVGEDTITGYRTFKDTEYFFQGHFPDYPVVPGVILVETMAQCGGAGVRKLGVLGEKLFFLATVEKAKFRRQVRPNDEVRIEVENIKISKRMIRQSGKAYVGDEVAAEAEWMCLVGDALA